MKKSHLNALIGLVAVIAIVVGVLVWPAPKEAKANELYLVHFYLNTPENGVEGLDVWIWFSEGEVHRDGVL